MIKLLFSRVKIKTRRLSGAVLIAVSADGGEYVTTIASGGKEANKFLKSAQLFDAFATGRLCLTSGLFPWE